MAHRPHLYVPGPWEHDVLALSEDQTRHLHRVLRVEPGTALTYTDGAGRLGSGRLVDAGLERGDEFPAAAPPELSVAVAPPHAKDRVRFLVEKLAELGVARIRWLRTRYGEGRPPRPDRAGAWTVAALEQSRGAWLTHVDEDWCTWEDLDPPVVVADAGGDARAPATVATLAVGPEGGWASDEVPAGLDLLSLGSRVLRVETAAIVGVARLVG
jgi:16S rRNA (uracil1498-N3)-methyltransferase